MQTQGATGTTIAPASVSVSGDVRSFALPNYAATPSFTNEKGTAAIAVDAFIPVIPGSKGHMGNSLSILGELVDGAGIADMYTGLTGGVGYPTLPATISAIGTTTTAAGKGMTGVAAGTPETITTSISGATGTRRISAALMSIRRLAREFQSRIGGSAMIAAGAFQRLICRLP